LLGLGASRDLANQLVGEACRQIAVFGEGGRRFEALAKFVVERKS
jgi:hypothetical protein